MTMNFKGRRGREKRLTGIKAKEKCVNMRIDNDNSKSEIKVHLWERKLL